MRTSIIILIIFLVSGFFYYKNIVQYKDVEIVFFNKEKEKENWNELNTAVIYVPSENGKNLQKKIVELDYYKDKRERLELIFKKIKENSNNYIVNECEILNIYIENNNVYININDLIKEKMTEATIELSVIYSIVNSFLEEEDLKKVKFLINSEEVKSIGGNIRASDFFEKDKILVKGD